MWKPRAALCLLAAAAIALTCSREEWRARRREGERHDVHGPVLACRACNVEPCAHLLTESPHHAPDADISEQLPLNFAKRQVTSDTA
ncbi:hypothetical protein CA603_26430 [Paraburkholderia hospita]|nr:hypothetical protein CA603_26430 [Paraburkholderia hospita]